MNKGNDLAPVWNWLWNCHGNHGAVERQRQAATLGRGKEQQRFRPHTAHPGKQARRNRHQRSRRDNPHNTNMAQGPGQIRRPEEACRGTHIRVATDKADSAGPRFTRHLGHLQSELRAHTRTFSGAWKRQGRGAAAPGGAAARACPLPPCYTEKCVCAWAVVIISACTP